MHDRVGGTTESAQSASFDAGLSASIASACNIKPTFIIGPPRSGTTLLAQILAHGEGVLSLSEPFFAVRALRPRVSRMLFQILRSYFHWRPRVPPTTCPAELFRFLRDCAWDKRQRLITKEVFSRFNHPHRLSNLETTQAIVASAAPIVAIVRDPYDTVASTLRVVKRYVSGWRRRVLWLACDCVPRFKDDEDIALHAAENWSHFATWVRQDQPLLVRYEELIRDTAGQVRHICDRLRLPFNEKMITRGHRPPAFGGLGDLSVVLWPSKSIHSRSVGRGRCLMPAVREIIRRTCGQSAAELGYAS